MDLNELIEKEGLESVSEKTNISIFNLNKLANEDFLELNRVKALGFLHILKREYEIDTTKPRNRSHLRSSTFERAKSKVCPKKPSKPTSLKERRDKEEQLQKGV